MPPPSFLVFRKLQDSVGNQETHDKEIAVDDYLCWTCQHHTYRLDYTTLMYRKLHLHLNRPGEQVLSWMEELINLLRNSEQTFSLNSSLDFLLGEQQIKMVAYIFLPMQIYKNISLTLMLTVRGCRCFISRSVQENRLRSLSQLSQVCQVKKFVSPAKFLQLNKISYSFLESSYADVFLFFFVTRTIKAVLRSMSFLIFWRVLIFPDPMNS